jgi:drug/metabolite transporter (DMT)-like permease
LRNIFSSTPAEKSPHFFVSAALFIVGVFLFACLDSIAKVLMQHYPVPLIAWAIYLSQFVLMTAILGPVAGRDLVRTNRPIFVIVRSLCLVLVSAFFLSSFARLPLAEATSILFVAPLFIVLLASPVLREHIGWPRWLAVGAGFVGVLLIVRPSGALDTMGIVFAVLAALFNALYQIFTRILSRTERVVTLLYYTGLVGTVAFGLVVPWFWDGPPPTAWYYVMFISLGVLGGVGHWFLTIAFRHAPASLLAPINYLQVVWATLLGWLVFDHFPDGITLIGMAIIAASGIAVTLYGQRLPVQAVANT